ncbi:MAG: hypothetical protein ACHQT8_05835 [Chlamydiales bacterium]
MLKAVLQKLQRNLLAKFRHTFPENLFDFVQNIDATITSMTIVVWRLLQGNAF